MPVKRADNGAALVLAITKEELAKIIQAKSVNIAGFESMASEGSTGTLGGTFSMVGAAPVISLALKNCVEQSLILPRVEGCPAAKAVLSCSQSNRI